MTNKINLILTLILGSMALFACGPTPDDLWARKALRSKIDQGALIIDVRTHEEYASGHITGAINIPHTVIRENLDKIGDDKSQSIVVYCGKGGRAATAKMVLEEEGYTNVWNLGGYRNLTEPVLQD
jgi:phage shock protein E